IFGFLVARQAYGSALLAPMFIVMSFAWGLAVFLVAQAAVYAWNGMTLPAEVGRRMTRLLGVFVAATLYLVAAHHMTNLYFARQVDFERFILVDGGIYPLLFWVGYVAIGSAIPMWLVFGTDAARPRNAVLASA